MRWKYVHLLPPVVTLAVGISLLAACGGPARRAADSRGRATTEARWIPFADRSEEGEQPSAQLLRSDSESIEIAFRFPGCWAQDVVVEADRAFTRLSGAGYGRGIEMGRPGVPWVRRSLAIPAGARVSIEIVDADYEERSLERLGIGPIMPAQPAVAKEPEEREPFMQDRAAYRANAFYPAEPALIEDEGVVRGRRLALLDVSPIAYNPARGEVRLYSSMTVRIRMPGGNLDQTRQDWGRFGSPLFDSFLAESVLNYAGLAQALEHARLLRIGYLIIVGHDDFYAPMLPFVALKQSEHYEVTMVRLSDFIADPAGMNPVDLKNAILQEIIALYQAGDPAPSFLLLVGDEDTIPPWNGDERPGVNGLGIPTSDMYYACMDGVPDERPDISYGRFPVRSAAETTWMVDKYLAYDALTGSEPWLERVAFAASSDPDHYAEAEGAHNFLIFNQTIPHHYTGSFPSDPQGGGDQLYRVTHGAVKADLRDVLNEGRWTVVYSGHGSSSEWQDFDFDRNDVSGLTSTGVLPFVASFACWSGYFGQHSYDHMVADTWVTLENKGALAYWGATHFTGWDTDADLEREAFDFAFSQSPIASPGYGTTLARIMEAGFTGIENIHGWPTARAMREMYHLLGDPSLRLWFLVWDDLYTAILDGNVPDDLVFQSAERGELSLYRWEEEAGLKPYLRARNLEATWDHVAVGNFTGDALSEVLLYDSGGGEATLFQIAGEEPGALVPIATVDDMGTGWDAVLTGYFGYESPESDFVFLYDADAESAEAGSAVYLARNGGLERSTVRNDLQGGWDLVSSGRFGRRPRASDLLFYDRDTGTAARYEVDRRGGLERTGEYGGLGKAWDIIVTGDFDEESPSDELLFYDRDSGTIAVYAIGDAERLRLLQIHAGVGSMWSTVVCGQFGGDEHTDLLCYDSGRGEGIFYISDGRAGFTAGDNPIGRSR